MSVSEYCNRDIVTLSPQATALDAAKLMRKHNVTSIIVLDESESQKKPIGILEDTALVREVMARKYDPGTILVETLMQPVTECAQMEEPVWAAVEQMRKQNLRRLPVVDSEGKLQGELIADDILALLTAGIVDIAALLRAPAGKKKTSRKQPRRKSTRRAPAAPKDEEIASNS